MTLVILLIAAIAVGFLLGLLAKMPAHQIVAQCAAMVGATLVFYGLVALL
jgi:hypothetical protein